MSDVVGVESVPFLLLLVPWFRLLNIRLLKIWSLNWVGSLAPG